MYVLSLHFKLHVGSGSPGRSWYRDRRSFPSEHWLVSLIFNHFQLQRRLATRILSGRILRPCFYQTTYLPEGVGFPNKTLVVIGLGFPPPVAFCNLEGVSARTNPPLGHSSSVNSGLSSGPAVPGPEAAVCAAPPVQPPLQRPNENMQGALPK